jgi:gas vesicle structural protein
MRRTNRALQRQTPDRVIDRVLEPPQASVLDVLDRLLDKGVIADGDLTIGVAGVDLIYVRLAAILCAADRVLPRASQLALRNERAAVAKKAKKATSRKRVRR